MNDGLAAEPPPISAGIARMSLSLVPVSWRHVAHHEVAGCCSDVAVLVDEAGMGLDIALMHRRS
jgi:hypothetical protein